MSIHFKNLVIFIIILVSYGCERQNTPTQNNSTSEGVQSIPQIKAIVGVDYVYNPMVEAALYNPQDFKIDDLYFQNLSGGISSLDEIFVLGKTSFSFRPTINDVGKHKVQLDFTSNGLNYHQEWEIEVIDKLDIPLAQAEVSNTGLDIIGKDLANFNGYNINIPAENKLEGAIVKLGMVDMDLTNGAFNYSDPKSNEVTAPDSTFVTFVVELNKIPSDAKETIKINLSLDPTALGLDQVTDKDIYMLATDIYANKHNSTPLMENTINMLTITNNNGILECEIEIPIGNSTATSFKLQLVKLYSATHVTFTLNTNSNIKIHWVVDPVVSSQKLTTKESLNNIKTYLNSILEDFKFADSEYVDMGCNSAKDLAVFVNPSFGGQAQNKNGEDRVNIHIKAYCKDQTGGNTCTQSSIAEKLAEQKSTIAHEYFHAIQYNYSEITSVDNEDPANWITESSAQYASDLINNDFSYTQSWYAQLYDEGFVNMGITGYFIGPNFPTTKDHLTRDYQQNLFLKYIDDLIPGTEGYNICSFITNPQYQALNILSYVTNQDKTSSDNLYKPLKDWVGDDHPLVDTYLDFVFDYSYQNIAFFPTMNYFSNYAFTPKSSFEIKGQVTPPIYQIDSINGGAVVEYNTDLDAQDGLYTISIDSFMGSILEKLEGGEFKAEFINITNYPSVGPGEPLAVLDHLSSKANVSLAPNSKYALVIAQSDFTRQLNGQSLSYEISITKGTLWRVGIANLGGSGNRREILRLYPEVELTHREMHDLHKTGIFRGQESGIEIDIRTNSLAENGLCNPSKYYPITWVGVNTASVSEMGCYEGYDQWLYQVEFAYSPDILNRIEFAVDPNNTNQFNGTYWSDLGLIQGEILEFN